MKCYVAISAILLAAFFLPSSDAFVVTTPATTSRQLPSLVPLFAEEPKQEKRGGLDESVRTKLVSESIAPWRTLRLFLYGTLGSGAFIGGLVTLTAAAAISSGARDGDLKAEVRTSQSAFAVKIFLVSW